MTFICVNSRQFDKKLSLDATVHDLVKIVLSENTEQDNVVTSIKLDNLDLNIESDSHLLGSKIDQFVHINLEIKNKLELAFEALDSCSGCLDYLIEKAILTANLFKEEDFEPANSNFVVLIDMLDLFVQLMSRALQAIKSSVGFQPGQGKAIHDLEIHLLSVLKALIPAREKRDLVMLCDLLEFELKDNLTKWKIEIVPSLKRPKNLSRAT